MNPKNRLEIFNNNIIDVLDENIGKTEIKIIKYNEGHLKEEKFDKCPQIENDETTWIKITYLSNDKLLKKLFKCLNLNEYVLKNVLTLDYIPDIEDYKDYLYIMLTAFYIQEKSKIERLQVSIILGKNFVISFHQDDAEIFNSVMNRLQIQEHHIRRKEADYLAYTLIDTVLDSHIITLKELEGELSKASEDIMDDPSTDNFRQIHTYRAELDKIRYYVLPLQQIMNSMELTESPLINQSTNTFLKNFQSHVAQVIDRIDTLSNRITEIRDIYNSSMSRRLDEIVRVLTVVTVLFAPGTFIVGIYGMNFQFMPELGQPLAYPIVLIINFVIVISLLLFFRKRNWI
ncbi:magnesium/cobalt transporter CorA [Methanobacterium oryzae]|uniref:magnesium/cobalt transporter CorA n=1 Tax=Methanobacterium oryzae TaxID=69540 RepID=UPI003D1ADC60